MAVRREVSERGLRLSRGVQGLRGLFGAIIACLSAGCGYTFQGSGSILPPDVKRVYIPVVENTSAEAGVSAQLTDALREQFERYGVVTVVDTEAEADAVLRARILKVQRGTSTTTSRTDIALQQQTTLTVGAELKRASGGVLWRDPSMVVTRSYGATGDVVVTSSVDFASGVTSASDLQRVNTREVARNQERQALEVLVQDVARRVYDGAVTPDF